MNRVTTNHSARHLAFDKVLASLAVLEATAVSLLVPSRQFSRCDESDSAGDSNHAEKNFERVASPGGLVISDTTTMASVEQRKIVATGMV